MECFYKLRWGGNKKQTSLVGFLMDSCVHQRNEEHWNLSIMCFHRCCLKIKARLRQVSFLPPHTRFLGSELNLELKIFPHEMPWQYSDFPASRFSSQRQFILISSVISVHYKDRKSASPLFIFLRFNCTPPSPEIETSHQKLMFSFWVYVFLVDFSRMQKQNKKRGNEVQTVQVRKQHLNPNETTNDK